jgi:CubicO group peptidase (beta-lactamase class C family)
MLFGAAALTGAASGATALAAPVLNRRPAMTARAFTETGLATIRDGMQRHIDAGYAPGMVGLVSRGGETHAFALGQTAFDGGHAMARDSQFRIASMTKPITAAAALILAEEGKLRLEEPVDRLLPELANRRVLKRLDGPLDDTVPAGRPITIEDLLTFRCGWGIVFADPSTMPLLKAITDRKLVGFGMPDAANPTGPDEWMRRLGALPLMYQPGEKWAYTTGSDILGVLVSRAAGQTLGEVFRTRLFEPLGMSSTAFHGSPDRLVAGYLVQDGKRVLYDAPDGAWSKPPAFEAGDSGLASTADDFAVFARMLLNGGKHGERQVVPAAAVRTMTADHLTSAQRNGGDIILPKGHGWGYSVSVVVDPDEEGLKPGVYGWNGGFGTSWLNDPNTGLTAVLLTQRFFDSPATPQAHLDFRRGAYRALA